MRKLEHRLFEQNYSNTNGAGGGLTTPPASKKHEVSESQIKNQIFLSSLEENLTFITREKFNSVKEVGYDYSLKLKDFIHELVPDYEIPQSFSFMKEQTITSLNVLLGLVKDLYSAIKDNLADIGSAIVHVLNFYIGTKNSKCWTDVSVGFVSLCLSLFKLDSIKGSAKYVQQIVGTFMDNLKGYFIHGESAEKEVRSFWSDLSVSNPRTLFGIVHSCSGILTSVICLRNFVQKCYAERDVSKLIAELSTGILKVGSEFRQHSESISLLLARIYDWVYLNSSALMSLKFDEIIWELPLDQVFESKYVEISNILAAIMEDPLYLEANNLTFEILRDRLNKLRASGEVELNKNPVPSTRAALTRYMTSIDGYIRYIEGKLNPDNTKPQPMSVTLVGPAGCGKSSAATKIGMMMQVIAGRIPDPVLLNNRGGDPKFEENITSSTDVIVYDDYANDQSKKMSTKEVLDIVNTSKEVIPKSRADEKGVHKYNNIGTIFTTNDRDLGMNNFNTASVDSLLRRMGVVVELGVKSEYCVPGTERLDVNHPNVSDEVFNTEIYTVNLRLPRAVVQNGTGVAVEYAEVTYENHPGNTEWRNAILKLQELLKEHWTSSVRRHKNSKNKENLCSSCSLPHDVCVCGVLKAESLSRGRFVSLFYDRPVASAQECMFALDDYCIDFSSRLAAKMSLAIYYKNCLNYALHRTVFYRQYWPIFLTIFAFISVIPFGCLLYLIGIAGFERLFFIREKKDHRERCIRAGRFIADSYKARYSAYAILFASSASALFMLFRSIATISEVVAKSEDANVTILNKDDDHDCEGVSFVDPPKKTNSDDLGYFLGKPRPAHQARTMTKDQVLADIAKHIAVATITSNGETSVVKSLPMGSERLIPNHALSKCNQDIVIKYGGSQGADYKNMDVPVTHISTLKKRKGIFGTKELDAALVHLPNMPPGKNFSKYFAEEGSLPAQAGCSYIHKDCDTGEWKEVQVRARMLDTPIRYQTNSGIQTQMVYECEARDHSSSDGDCGQPLIYNNSIIGIHIAGTSSNKWYCLAIDASTLEAAREVLKRETSILVASLPPEPVFKNNKKDLSIIDGETSYVCDALQTAVTPIVSLGVLVDAAKNLYRPRAEDYYFRNGNEQVEKEFGPLSSRPPKYVNGKEQINTTLLKFNTPKMDVPIGLMDRAMEDYLYSVTCTGQSLADVASELERAQPGFFSVRPLQQALDGDQSGIIRGMNNSTSSGICYGGKKTNWMKMKDDGQPIIPRVLDSEIESDIYKIEDAWRSGQGTFDPFVRASKTNEVLPLEKAYEKTRSIYGNDMAFFIAATRGIIPLKHVLRNMKASECFVGLTAQSKQWQEDVYDYLTKDGEYTNFVCGDFSGYDTQLPKALLEKSGAIIMKIYRDNGASDSDLEYLRGFLSSVVSPVMVWEGHLLQFCSGQPSGQPLTVEKNSIVNSLLVRMAFYVIMDREYPEIKNPVFREWVRLAVYGDDNAMGVDSRIPKFNHTSIQAVFASWGIKYTMADKGADSVPYQTIEEVSFLKRSFRYHPQLNAIVAPIEEESLTKKMYWWTKSKNTPLSFPEQFQANFESQSREAYLHGEEFYEEFVRKCERIREASESGDERFVLPWNTIQPLSAKAMCAKLYGAYHPEE